tara:strand:+ start:9662 stop:9838 length:177 start_codon:yes stop_codon:yes gene_type:complete
MVCPPQGHEKFCPLGHGFAGLTPVAQILNEAGIGYGKSSESCPSHVSFTQEYLDFSQQ